MLSIIVHHAIVHRNVNIFNKHAISWYKLVKNGIYNNIINNTLCNLYVQYFHIQIFYSRLTMIFCLVALDYINLNLNYIKFI